MAKDALIQLTRPQFENLMETQGLEGTVDGVLSIANEELELEAPLTRESLASGTHPLLDKLDRYKGIAPEERKVTPEEILTLFTNVEDFGKYDPERGGFSGLKSFGSGAARMVPETVGGGLGAKAGLAAVSPIAAMIPPAGLPGLAARGLVYGVGAISGAILGAMGAGATEDALIGEAAPVVPSLEPAYRGGETAMFTLSMLGAPYKLATSIPKAKLGALDFLENFTNVSSGRFTNVADEAFQVAAREAGLSQQGATKLFETARRAREVASERGPMFGGALGADLGVAKFNPAGYIFDPRKGPVAARVMGGLEGGIERSMAAARDKPGRFLAAEGLTGLGAGLGAGYAQSIDPYDEGARLTGELLGSLVVPIPLQVAVDSGPELMRGVFRTVRNWWSSGTDEGARQGLLRGRMERESGRRFLSALRRSQEFAPRVDPETGEVIETADEQLNRFITALGEEAAKERLGPDGKPVQLTAADLATMEGLPFSPTMQVIQRELAKSSADLRAATGRGREELQAGAINAIRALASTGDPAALAYAARIQQGLFEQNIIDNIDGAVTKLTEATTRVLGREAGDLSDRSTMSENLYKILDNQIELSKVRERRLWSDVKNFPLTEFYSRNGRQISQPNVLQLLDRSSSRGGLNFSSKGAQAELNAALGKYKDDLDDLVSYFQDGQGRNPATAQKFFEMRSGLLNKAAQLRKVGDIVNAGRLDKINDALLRDLTGQRDGVSEAYNTARAYTFARNNVFTRSFLNQMQVVDRNRGLILDPKNLLDGAFRGGNLKTAQRFEQIRAAGRFLIDEAGFTEEAVRAMDVDQIMTAALRDSLGKVMDKKMVKNPATGEMIETFVVNPNKLETWKKQPGTKQLFTLVNELEQDFANAQTAQKAFDGMLDDISDKLKPSEARRLKFTDEQMEQHYGTKAFQWVLQYEDPGEVVSEALSAEKPSLALNALYRMVNEADYKGAEFTKNEALAGLKQAIFNNALREASKQQSGLPNGDVLQRKLFAQIPGVRPDAKLSMSDFMIRKGLATEAEMEEVQKAVKTMRGIEEAFATNNFENVLFKKPSLGKLFWLRIGGATAGTAAQQQLKKFLNMPQMSGGLIAEQTGSEFVQRVLLRGPETQQIKVMTEMLSNPKLLAEIMKEINDAEMADKALTRIEKMLAPLARQTGRRLPLGIRAAEEAITEEYEAPEGPAVPPPPPPLLRRPTLPPATAQGATVPPARPPTQGGGAAPSPMQQVSAAPRPTPPTPTGPVDRARFAALFPEDRDLMGIASLSGVS